MVERVYTRTPEVNRVLLVYSLVVPFPRDYCFKLEGHTPVAVSLEAYARWDMSTPFERKIVGKDQVGEVEVSTVFLGLNHQFFDGPPLVFETMVFGGLRGDYQKRYSTWVEAERGHAQVLAEVLALEAPAKEPEKPASEPADPSTKTRLERAGEE